MSLTDPIADFLTRVRNALQAGFDSVECPASKANKAIARILKEEGFVEDYMVLDDRKQGIIRIDLKYIDSTPVIEKMERVSRPGCRVYAGADELPDVLGGLGIGIVSTSHGIMTVAQAREKHVGGEVLCSVY